MKETGFDKRPHNQLWFVACLLVTGVCVAAASFVMLWVFFLPGALACTLALPFALRPKRGSGWVWAFVGAFALLFSLTSLTAFMHIPLLDALRGNPIRYEWQLLLASSGALFAALLALGRSVVVGAPERHTLKLRTVLPSVLAWPFTALTYWIMAINGLPLSA